MDDANASFSTGGGTGTRANTTTQSSGGGSGGGKNSKGGHNNDNMATEGKTFHVEGFEGMEFMGNMDEYASGGGTGVGVTNVTNSSSSSSGAGSGSGSGSGGGGSGSGLGIGSVASVPMRFKERMTNKHMGPSYIDPLPSHFPGNGLIVMRFCYYDCDYDAVIIMINIILRLSCDYE